MIRHVRGYVLAAVAATAIAGGSVAAAERTVTLAVENMTCASCPYIVRESLLRVDGVSTVAVSFADKTAVVTFDDAMTDAAALTRATAEVGFPARPLP
jgi:mercuric ion binding protein